MMSERTKGSILAVISISGVMIVLAVVLLCAFGGLWSRVFAADKVTFTTDGYIVVASLTAGITMAALGISTSIRMANKSIRKRIDDFVTPILKSKGKVSLKEIASHVKVDAKVVERDYLKPMVEEGYFEEARYENGWLVKDSMPCPYCNEPVKLADKKCPNCGAAVKK